jgi:ubiquinone/menaquinone biosynthesis C-methylase UbiE
MRERTLDTRTRLDEAGMRAYWQRVSRDHLSRKDDHLATVCFAGMPSWFNNFIDRYQLKAFERLLCGESFAGSDVLDVGTGTGRWARWYAASGANVTGIDLEEERLARAATLGGGPRYLNMSAASLDFPDASFDVVNSVTVLQHIPDATRLRAIAELSRVLRPGGRAVIFELTDRADDAPHVFPWSARQWTRAFSMRGLRLQRTVGEQYIPLLRAMKRAHQALRGGKSRAQIDALKAGDATRGGQTMMLALRAVTLASYPLEECCRWLPPEAARITGFLFVKDDYDPTRPAAG